MVLGWLRRRRRRKLLAAPFPAAWRTYLEESLPFYSGLNDDERRRLEGIAAVLLAEKRWEGCGGLELTAEMRLHVAAQAALLLLNLEHDYYERLRSIFLYPTTFVVPDYLRVGRYWLEGRAPVAGIAHGRGPVVLAWDAVLRGGREPHDAQNPVFHEFAHQLDYLDSAFDGTPPLSSREEYRSWVLVMTDEYRKLAAGARKGVATLLDKYGARNSAEFFAVATECFFERPRELEERHALLYGVLRDYYRQDPAARERRRG